MTDVGAGLFDLLVPPSDKPLEDFANIAVLDGGVEVRITAVDQVLASLARNAVAGSISDTVVAQLPRGSHQVSLLVGIASQLLCRQAPAGHAGPVIVIASDIDLIGRLRALGVQGRHRMGLARGNPLHAHRVRRDGTLQPAHGQYADDINSSLLYLNTRVGWPSLRYADPGLVILDGVSIRNPIAREEALRWAGDQKAKAVIVVGDLGDRALVQAVTAVRPCPLVVPLTWADLHELGELLGRTAPAGSSLATGALLQRDEPEIIVHRIEHAEIDEALTDAFGALAAMPAGPLPHPVTIPRALIQAGSRLLAHPDDYRSAAAMIPARAPQSPVVLRRLLDRQGNLHLPTSWSAWKTSRAGTLNHAARALWNVLDRQQPKLDALWDVLDQLDRTGENRIVIRCPGRAGADALQVSLVHDRRTDAQRALWERVGERVHVARFADRFSWSDRAVEVLAGNPPPSAFPLFVGGEARAVHLLAYGPEVAAARRAAERWAAEADGHRRQTCAYLGVAPPVSTSVPIEAPPERAVIDPVRFRLPKLGLGDILDRASAGIDERQPEELAGGAAPDSTTRSAIPVQLERARTWWAADDGDGEATVPTVTAAGVKPRRVRELRKADEIVVPAGDGTDSVHARLVAASHRHADVAALDALLAQFRRAARDVISRERSLVDALERVRIAGAQAYRQLPAWASGETIAPVEPADVAAVFRAANRPCPDLAVLYEVANTLRSLHRSLGRLVSAVRAGRGSHAVDQLSELVGEMAEELIEEFTVERVVSVGEPVDVAASQVGRVTH